ncbi:MAG: PVC-type heme-binding CxxCH protein [Pirellulales bacterium]
MAVRSRSLLLVVLAFGSIAGGAIGGGSAGGAESDSFRAGAAVVDVTPRQLPVIRNGGFTEATDDRVVDPLHARCLCLDGGDRPVALVVVDSCMIPVDVCDRAKELAHQLTGIPRDRMLISATHAHSCPSVMDYCLGSRADPAYRDFLPGKIAEAIQAAYARLEPAGVGWVAADAGDYTKNRRWITRPDKLLTDPFGDRSVRAMMHPGHENPEYIGPSGPVDPWLSLLAVRSNGGRPIAVLGNFSMHYFGGHPGVSADYCGRFCRGLEERFQGENGAFVALMSQGTSGDLWWGDYARPAVSPTIDEFTLGLVKLAADAVNQVTYRLPDRLDMVERRLTIDRRRPSTERLAWAKRTLALMGDRRPENQPEVYAEQAVYLDSQPTDEVVLQAIQIGPSVITAMPNEVFALTGLKLKAQSPLEQTMNIELANGASGYIPPPEQHALGGYTTWPARTAGLAVDAEPKIVEQLLEMLEQLTGKPRRIYIEPESSYSRVVSADRPSAYWGCGDQSGATLSGRASEGRLLTIQGHVAYHLPGAEGAGLGDKYQSRSVQLVGGYLEQPDIKLDGDYSVSGWFWNGMPGDVRPTTGELIAVGTDVLALTGTSGSEPLRLAVGDRRGNTALELRTWYHVALVRRGQKVEVYLNGVRQDELSGDLAREAVPARGGLRLGQADDANGSWEGRIDEVAVFDRALSSADVARHVAAATIRTDEVRSAPLRATETPPLEPAEAQRQISVRDGFRLELVAAEPLVRDPVAIDWGLDGRLWVAEMADYPSGMDGQGKPGGRIRWLADTDGDGKYDQSTVFLEDVSFPNGVLAWQDGVLVTAAPEILWARDTDGDGKADQRVPLYSGFLAGNQQLRVNGLRWGLDNWIHCASGGHHAGYGADNTVVSLVTGQQVLLGSRDLRIRPEQGLLEPESGPSQFGRVRDDAGDWFGVQNSMPLWHYVLEDRYLARNPAVAAPDVRHQVRVPLQPPVYPAKTPEKRYHGFDQTGHYTSACGIEIYRDELLFPRESGRQQAFTCEPFHNLVQHHWVDDDGVTFRGQRAADDGPLDFIASADRWCRPVMIRTGPDGALYVVDMYRYMIEHPEWLPPDGKEELRPFYRAGEAQGRIYRVVRNGQPLREVPKLVDRTPVEWVAFLDHPNGVVRDWAQRSLVAIDDRSAVDSLSQMARSGATVWGRLQALSVLSAWDALHLATWHDAVQDNDPRVQRWAIRLSETWAAELDDELRAEVVTELARLVAHPDPRVRLQLACTLGEFSGPEAARALARLASQAEGPYERAAVLSSLPTHWRQWLPGSGEGDAAATAVSDGSLPDYVVQACFAMSAADGDQAAQLGVLEGVLGRLDRAWTADNLQLLASGLETWQQRGVDWKSWVHQQTGREDQAEAEVSDDDGTEAARLDTSGVKELTAVLARAAQVAADVGAEVGLRTAAIGLLSLDDATREDQQQVLLNCLSIAQPVSVQLAAVQQLVRNADTAVADQVLARLSALSPEVRQELIRGILQRPQLIGRLLAYCVEHRGVVQELSLADRQRLLTHDDPSIAAAARELFAAAVMPARLAVVDDYSRQIAAMDMSAEKQRIESGRQLFARHCAVCHLANPADRGDSNLAGGDGVGLSSVGPDLTTLTDRSVRGLLTAVLDPSRSVEPKYAAYTVVLTDGQVLQGVVAAETATSLELRLADGKRVSVVRSTIEEITGTGRSLMPDGMETVMNPAQLADLIIYLGQIGKE